MATFNRNQAACKKQLTKIVLTKKCDNLGTENMRVYCMTEILY